MNAKGSTPKRGAEQAMSRFSHHGDEPDEGGVHGVRATVAGGHSATAGVPRPEERLLDISELARNVGMRYTHHFRIPPTLEKDFETVTPIEGEVTLTNTGAALLLRGTAEATLRLECARCLSLVDVPVTAELSEEFNLVTSRNAFHQEEVQAVDDDAPAAVISGNVLDLGDLLRQDLLLAAPLQPLCREECPGLLGQEAAADAEGDNPLRRLADIWHARKGNEAERG
jgi:uncharacterized metal-binding protein YceD (DUF177 family)